MNKTYTSNLLMIRPINFGFNEQTAVNNYFQNKVQDIGAQPKALSEFDAMVTMLQAAHINVIVIDDTPEPHTPDSIFPNNWVSFHANGCIGLYPMFAVNRRLERREDILKQLEEKGFEIREVIDYSSAEEEDIYLEGTGSMILDRTHKIAYAAKSLRTDEFLFEEFCEDFEYTPVVFGAFQTEGNERKPIYHTNVMMCVADEYAIVCLDCIDDKAERKMVAEQLTQSGKEIIAISEAQMHQFAGNMLQVCNSKDEKFLVMSQTAKDSLNAKQIESIENYNSIISPAIPTIEKLGGGSVRCMMAEVFLPKIN